MVRQRGLSTRKTTEAEPQGLTLGRWLKKAQVRRPVRGAFNPLAFRGERRSHHACFRIVARISVRISPREFLPVFASILLTALATLCQAASVHGVVTDTSGAKSLAPT